MTSDVEFAVPLSRRTPKLSGEGDTEGHVTKEKVGKQREGRDRRASLSMKIGRGVGKKDGQMLVRKSKSRNECKGKGVGIKLGEER